LLTFSHRQLDHLLRAYVEHYNETRPLRGIGLETPRPAVPGDPAHGIERRDVLGGLIHECRRERRDVLGGLIHECRRAT
jgi:hypothetical protein